MNGEMILETEKKVNQSLSDKYLTFKLGDEEYGVPILMVQRIIQMQPITPVPKTPSYVRGVINLRGKIIPIVEMRKKFQLNTTEDTDVTCIVVVQLRVGDQDITMGTLIDEVSEVVFIEENQIQDTPSFGTGVDTDFIMGVAKLQERVIMLLDINKILSPSELDALSAMN
ncbi:MAG: chemotaxis protein CheW [Fibrobacterales bacterium]